MKKTFLLMLVLILLLSACGELTPIEKCQQKAVSIGEQFLNFEITGTEARELLNGIKVPETEGNGQLYLEVAISALAFMIGMQDSTYEEIDEKIESIRNTTYKD